MKILLIRTEGGERTEERLRSLFEQKSGRVTTLKVDSPEGDKGNIRLQFSSFFEPEPSKEEGSGRGQAVTHGIIVSPLPQRWLDFLAGFSYGSRLPFIVYGEESIAAVPVEFASCFRPFKTESSLVEYLSAENEAFEKWELAQGIIKARELLLQVDIPVTGESLAQCAANGAVREVMLFLAAGFSPDTRNKAGVPLLCVAARKGNREVVRVLIQSGADLNLQADDRGTSALLDSVMSRHYEIAPDLIKAGADVNIKSKDGQSALVVAVGNGKEDVVEALLRAGADPDAPDSLGTTARKYAALFHKSSIVALFDAFAPLPEEAPAPQEAPLPQETAPGAEGSEASEAAESQSAPAKAG